MKRSLPISAALSFPVAWACLALAGSGCASLRDRVAGVRYGQSGAGVEAAVGREHATSTVTRGTLWTYRDGREVCEIEFRSERVTTPPACKTEELADAPDGAEQVTTYVRVAESVSDRFYRERLEARAKEYRKYVESRRPAMREPASRSTGGKSGGGTSTGDSGAFMNQMATQAASANAASSAAQASAAASSASMSMMAMPR